MTYVFSLLACCTTNEKIPTPKPDVLVLVMDTVRADHLSTYGYHRQTSPHLSALAEQGVLFVDVTAASSWTWPSHASIFTGVMPEEHHAHRSTSGVQLGDSEWFLASMTPELPTFGEAFSKAGYATYAFSTNALLSQELGLMRGFQHVQAIDDEQITMENALAVLSKQHEQPILVFVNLMTAHAPYLVMDALEYSKQHKASFSKDTAPSDWRTPYLFTEYPGIHFPYFLDDGTNGEMNLRNGTLKIPEADKQAVIDLYDGELLRLDAMLRQLLLAWGDREGIIAVTSDHGEYLFEHQRVGHGVELHPEVLSVPLVITYPGNIKPEKIVHPVSLIRLAATLLNLANISSEGALNKRWSLFTHKDEFIEASVWGFVDWGKHVDSQFAQKRRWFREGNLASWITEDGFSWICNLQVDPHCVNDISEENQQWKEKMMAIVKQRFIKDQNLESPYNEQLKMETLKKLGYIEE